MLTGEHQEGRRSGFFRPFRPQSTQARHSCTLPVTLAAAEQRSSPSTIYIV